MPRSTFHRGSRLACAGLAVAAACVALPAFAQTVQGLTITGHYRVGADTRSVSAAVPYSDLDLKTPAGRDVFKQRVRATAHDLCERLGETNSTPGVGLSCEQDAWQNARDQIHVAVRSQMMPDYAYIAPDETYAASSATTYNSPASTVAPGN